MRASLRMPKEMRGIGGRALLLPAISAPERCRLIERTRAVARYDSPLLAQAGDNPAATRQCAPAMLSRIRRACEQGRLSRSRLADETAAIGRELVLQVHEALRDVASARHRTVTQPGDIATAYLERRPPERQARAPVATLGVCQARREQDRCCECSLRETAHASAWNHVLHVSDPSIGRGDPGTTVPACRGKGRRLSSGSRGGCGTPCCREGR